LAVIFPDHVVEVALLYTSGPLLIPLDDAALARGKRGLAAAEQSLVADG